MAPHIGATAYLIPATGPVVKGGDPAFDIFTVEGDGFTLKGPVVVVVNNVEGTFQKSWNTMADEHDRIQTTDSQIPSVEGPVVFKAYDVASHTWSNSVQLNIVTLPPPPQPGETEQ